MQALYLASEGPAGKTALVAALGRRYQARGKSLGYVKLSDDPQDVDVAFLRQALGLGEGEAIAAGATHASAQRARLQGRDIVILEGPLHPEVARAWEARVVLVMRHTPGPPPFGAAPASERLLGVVINQVTGNGYTGSAFAQDLKEKGIRVLGQLPEERFLRAPTVAQLVEWLGGKVLNAEESTGALVEHFLVGALRPDSTLPYLQSRSDKAVITRGNRPDIQLAALETDVRCLVLTGGAPPLPIVLRRAVEQGVPLVQVTHTTKAVTEALGPALSEMRFGHPEKIERLQKLMEERLDLAAIDQALGA